MKEILIPSLDHQYALYAICNTPEYARLYKGPTFEEAPSNKNININSWAKNVRQAMTSSTMFVKANRQHQSLLRAATTPLDTLAACAIIYYE